MMETQRGDDSDPENTKFQYLFDSLQQEFQQQLKLVKLVKGSKLSPWKYLQAPLSYEPHALPTFSGRECRERRNI
ncbi:hypothetical protein QQG55_46360 [Brugia pahangi]